MSDNADWLQRIVAVENDVKELRSALIGTLDGKPGLRSQVDQLMQLTQANNETLDSLRMDRAKVAGIVLATGAIVGIGLKLLHL